MKKIILLLSIIAVTVLTSCEKDEPTLKSETIDTTETGYDTFKYEVITESNWTTIAITDSLSSNSSYDIYEPQTWVYEWKVEKPYAKGYVNVFLKAQDNNTIDSQITIRLYKNGELIEEKSGSGATISKRFE